MKKVLLTAFDENMVSEKVLNNKKKYAEKYGWELKLCEGFIPGKPPAFSKIPWIIEELKHYDLIFWNDFDSIFTNFSIDITDSLGEDDYFGMYEEHPSYFCAGNILIKKCEYTEQFFKEMMRIPSWNNNNHPWEQRVFNELASLRVFKHIKRFKASEFGAFQEETGWVEEPWKPGYFMLHLCSRDCAGEIPWSLRMKQFDEKYEKLII